MLQRTGSLLPVFVFSGALQLLCSDAAVSGGAFAFAPLRAVDLNAN